MNQIAPEPIRLFDTHAHPGAWENEGLPAVLARARAAGVSRVLAVGGTPEANRLVVAAARAQPREVRAAVGINRDQAGTTWSADELAALLAAPETAAVGEVGLDFHRAAPDRETQLRLFERMLDLACASGRPIIVHSRAAEAETISLLERHVRRWAGDGSRIGVQHCFTGTQAFAARLLELGFFISFSGILTFKNAGALRQIAAGIPEDRLLIETDSPWLAPEPFRGKPNEPAQVRRVAETLAEIRRCSVEDIASATFRNAERLFGT